MIIHLPRRPAIDRSTVAFWVKEVISGVLGEQVEEAHDLAENPEVDEIDLMQIGLEIERQLLVVVLDYTEHLPVTTVGRLIDITHAEIDRVRSEAF